ncbi:MAG: T9SS type A sorting domain-containing protein [Flavobacteriales bacterium]|nr:T9SS type A sorting domain-containing protein [Flavobacteriales bacterium]
MNKLLITFLLAFPSVALHLNAQPTFEKIYITVGSYNLYELSNQNIITGMGDGVLGFSLLDSDGDMLESHCPWGDSIIGFRSFVLNDSLIYFSTWIIGDTCTEILNSNQSYPVIESIDLTGNVLSIHYYDFNTDCNIGVESSLEVAENKDIILGGRRSFILRADSSGQLVWARNFGRRVGVQFVRELPGGDLLAGFNLDTAGAAVARLDANGEFLWCKSYLRPKGMVHDCVINSDSSFIITGTTDSTFSYPSPEGFDPLFFMLNLNGAGEVQWCMTYDSDPPLWRRLASTRIEKTLDGKLIVLADNGRPFLMKTDLNGDTLWTRSFGETGYGYSNMDLLVHSDGGILFTGRIEGDLPEWSGAGSFLFKTDSLGHLPCSTERSSSVQVAAIWPTDSSFTLSSIDGGTAVSLLSRDTVFDPFIAYNSCDIAYALPHRPERVKPTIHPNPSTGRFTVQFNDPLRAEQFYSVYDPMGRLLFQHRLPRGQQTVDLDLSLYGSGTYVIRFTSPEEVYFERVVVE